METILGGAARRKIRTRAKIRQGSERLRLSVFRSHRYIYAQIIDDRLGKTLVSANEKDLPSRFTSKAERAFQVGKILAQKAAKMKIKNVVFDRGGCQYHGRVKALADGAREGGLEF